MEKEQGARSALQSTVFDKLRSWASKRQASAGDGRAREGDGVHCPVSAPPCLDPFPAWPCKHQSLPSLSWSVLSLSTQPLPFRQWDPRELPGGEMLMGTPAVESSGLCTNQQTKQRREPRIPWQVRGLWRWLARGRRESRTYPVSRSHTEIRSMCPQVTCGVRPFRPEGVPRWSGSWVQGKGFRPQSRCQGQGAEGNEWGKQKRKIAGLLGGCQMVSKYTRPGDPRLMRKNNEVDSVIISLSEILRL